VLESITTQCLIRGSGITGRGGDKVGEGHYNSFAWVTMRIGGEKGAGEAGTAKDLSTSRLENSGCVVSPQNENTRSRRCRDFGGSWINAIQQKLTATPPRFRPSILCIQQGSTMGTLEVFLMEPREDATTETI